MNATGVIVLAVFGAIWCGAALAAMTGGIDALTFAPALVAVVIIVLALKAGRAAPRGSAEQGKRIGRVIGLASLFEGIAIPVVASMLGSIGRYDLVMPAIAAIVGLHFLPIGWVTRYLPFYVLAGVLLALAVGSALLLPPTAVRVMVVGFGAGVLLWVACVVSLRRLARLSAGT